MRWTSSGLSFTESGKSSGFLVVATWSASVEGTSCEAEKAHCGFLSMRNVWPSGVIVMN
jgi:hypothetical protein